MALASAPTAIERRKFIRSDSPRFGVDLLQPSRPISIDSVNISEGGLCLRIQEILEVRSLVRLQLTLAGSGGHSRRTSEGARQGRGRWPLTCTGRVAWVVQRLDLRDAPPFLFDVGIEFVDPPPLLRQFLAQRGLILAPSQRRAARSKALTPSVIRGRQYVPRLERTPDHATPWHLVVTVDGIPCFSDRLPSERASLATWAQFKRRQARR